MVYFHIVKKFDFDVFPFHSLFRKLVKKITILLLAWCSQGNLEQLPTPCIMFSLQKLHLSAGQLFHHEVKHILLTLCTSLLFINWISSTIHHFSSQRRFLNLPLSQIFNKMPTSYSLSKLVEVLTTSSVNSLLFEV